MNDYEMTIGIECHVQLATKTKLFSPADNDARDAEPNSKTHPIDFGLPGMLPILNREAVNLAIKAGKALNADIARTSRFDRKHYFYPDLPKGYQTSQMYQPIILAGFVDAPLENGEFVRVRVHHAHMEEDAGKLTHYADHSLVDLNRAGTPLIEIVSEPDIHSAEAAKAYATELYRLMTYAGVTHGDLYHGNMRFDVNISVAKKGSDTLGTRAEVKNLNSFRSVEKAAEYEFKRQVELLERGEKVVQETRGWDDAKQKTNSQRSKEDAQDYRYMPDADIPPIVLTDEEIMQIQSTLPKLPPQYREEFAGLELDKSVLNKVMDNQQHAKIVASFVEFQKPDVARRVANWIASVVNLSETNRGLEADEHTMGRLGQLATAVDQRKLTGSAAKQVFSILLNGCTDAEFQSAINTRMQSDNDDYITMVVDEVLADPACTQAVADIRAGNDKAIGFLVGQIMKKSQGKANPGLAQKLIRERL